MVAKPDTRDEVAGFLADAVRLAEAEPGTPVWFALRTDDTTLWTVDAFPARPSGRRTWTVRSRQP